MISYLEFEKPVAALEARIAELRELAKAGDVDIASEIARHEFGKRQSDIIDEMRAHRMARNLRLLPRRKRGVCTGEQLRAFLFKPGNFGRNIDVTALASSRSSAIRASSAATGFSNSRYEIIVSR